MYVCMDIICRNMHALKISTYILTLLDTYIHCFICTRDHFAYMHIQELSKYKKMEENWNQVCHQEHIARLPTILNNKVSLLYHMHRFYRRTLFWYAQLKEPSLLYGFMFNRIRIPYNCIELIFGIVHPSTFEHLKTQFLLVSSSNVFNPGGSSSVTEEDPQGRNVFKHSKVEGCTIPKIGFMFVTILYLSSKWRTLGSLWFLSF